MSQLNKAAFLSLYGSSGTIFPDNTTGEISEGDMRQFGQDIADTFNNILDTNISFPNSDFSVTIAPWENFSGSNRSGEQSFNWSTGGFLVAVGSPQNSKYLAIGRSGGWPAGDYTVLIRAKNNSDYGGSGGDALGIGVWTMTDGLNQTTVSVTGTTTLPRDNTYYTRALSFTLSSPAPYLAFELTRGGGGGTFDINASIDYIRLDSFTAAGVPSSGLQDVLNTDSILVDAVSAITGPNGIDMQFGASTNGVNGLDFTADEFVLSAQFLSILDDISAGNMGLIIDGTTEELDLFTGTSLIQMLGSGGGVINFAASTFNFNNGILVGGLIGSTTPGGGSMKNGGVIHVNTTSSGNVGTGDDTLMSYSLPAGTLAANNQGLYITASGTFVVTVSGVRLRIKFGSDTIFDSGTISLGGTNADWSLEAEIIRTGATTQKCVGRLTTGSASLSSYCDYSTASQTLSGAVTIAITGEATNDNDIVAQMMRIRYEP